MRNKKPAQKQIGIELDPSVIKHWKTNHPNICDLIHGDAISILNGIEIDQNTVIYADPPYHPNTRLRNRVYKYDYSIKDHIQLLEYFRMLPCKILISGYPSDLYNDYLADWNTYKFNAKTHSGVREEWIWYNYNKPVRLHDSRFLGSNFREREQFKRRLERLKTKIENLSDIEQSVIFQWMKDRMD